MTRDELLRAWVDALESGKYTQGVGRLRDKDTYCCLGVYCDISGQGEWSDSSSLGGYVFYIDHGAHFQYLPPLWRDVIGLSFEDQRELANANDAGETFPQIAQRIRTLFPDVFTVNA